MRAKLKVRVREVPNEPVHECSDPLSALRRRLRPVLFGREEGEGDDSSAFDVQPRRGPVEAVIPEGLRAFPAGVTEGLSANVARCSNAFAAAATAALLAEPEDLIGVDPTAFEKSLAELLPVIGVRWSADDAGKVAASIDATELSGGAAAAVLAEHIDALLGPRFDDLVDYPSEWTLEPGDPFPVRVPPIENDTYPSPHPFALPATPGDLRNLRFVPQAGADWTVSIHWHARHAAVVSKSGARISTAHPNVDLDEFGAVNVSGSTFFGFVGRDPNQSDWIDQAAALAVLGSDVVMLPELAVEPADVTRLVEMWKALPPKDRPNVFVPGSAHVVDGATRANRAQIHIRGLKAPIIVDKQEPFRIGGLTEGIDRVDPTVQVHVVGGWRIFGAICRDVLRPGLTDILAQLGVTLALIPAMSPSLTSFESLNTIPTRNWGIAVVANNPSFWPARDRHTAKTPPQLLVEWPREQPVGLTHLAGISPAAVRGAWTLDLAANTSWSSP